MNLIRHKVARLAMMLALLPFATMPTSCSRSHYRKQADSDAYCLIREKTAPHWELPDASIEVDPRSRMYSPDAVDCPPMPPDDPAAHRYMHCIDGKRGAKGWHCNGDTPYVANPNWAEFLPYGPDGIVSLQEVDAVQLALLHSSDYQTELEDLYLSALDVSFERFRFDRQFFGGYEVEYTADGRLRPSSGGESRSVLDVGTFPASRGIRMEKLMPAGGELVVGLANRLMWQFSGPDTHSATTLLDFTLVQPLLRGGGRARVMERLTIAERSLLANVRQMERFRRGFYLEITTGRDAGAGPNRRGGFFGGSGLEGFTGVGGGGFGRVGGGGGGTTTGGAGAAQAGGYLGLLQEQQNIRNQRANVASLRSSLAQLDAFFQAGRIDFFQVELARQALYNAQSRLLNAETSYQTGLDSYKLQLGLPPDVPIRIDDNLLDAFNLIDPRIVVVQEQIGDLQDRVGAIIAELTGLPEGTVWDESVTSKLTTLRGELTTLVELANDLNSQHARAAEADIARLESVVPQRVAELKQLREKMQESNTLPELDERIVGSQRVESLPTRLRGTLTELMTRISNVPGQVAEIDATLVRLIEAGPTLEPGQVSLRLARDVLPVPNLLAEFTAQSLELALVQVRARTDSISLPSVNIQPQDALAVAREARRDWMNARANLVDSWRLIRFNANDLESSLDVVFNGDITNTGDNPLRLRGDAGRLQVGLQFDAPITRLGERNTYRQALIEYHQARRSFYRFEDQVNRGLRQTLRTIDLHQVNFELRRAAIHVAVAQVELARLRLQEPPKPDSPQGFGATTARDLVSALSDLLNVQNDFLSVWVNYEVQRRSLDFDMGTMMLDPTGIWVDPGSIGPEHGNNQANSEQPLIDPSNVGGLRRLPQVESIEQLLPPLHVDDEPSSSP